MDDNSDFLPFAHDVLSRVRPDFVVHEFLSSVAALEFLGHHHVDLIVTDFKMPVIDGAHLATVARSMNANVPILIMSGDAMARESLAAGADAFLSKDRLVSELKPTLASLGITEALQR